MSLSDLEQRLSGKAKLAVAVVAIGAASLTPLQWAFAKNGQVNDNSGRIASVEDLAKSTAGLAAELAKQADAEKAAERAKWFARFEGCQLGHADLNSEWCRAATVRWNQLK